MTGEVVWGRHTVYRGQEPHGSAVAKTIIAGVTGTLTMEIKHEDGTKKTYSGLKAEIFEGSDGMMGFELFYPIQFVKR